MRGYKRIKESVAALIKLNTTPPEIALGVAIGVFIAVMPLYGFHTLLVIVCAVLIPKANKIAMLLGTNISLPPTVPFITWAGYEIGRSVLRRGYPPLRWSFFSHLSLQTIRELYYPLFLGSVILGAACALLCYGVTLFFAMRLEKKKTSGN